MKLLVVEDENKTADYVRQGLMEAGFVVDLARNGLDGHHLAMGETYDLVVLDVMLPDVDGWRIVRALRDAGKQVSVLFLTARGGVDDRVKVRIPRHSDTQPTLIRTPVPRSFGQAVGAQRRRGGIVSPGWLA
ncbi:response regulator, partial [Pseudomonas aeruginosa]